MPKTGDEVGREKAAWVADSSWRRREVRWDESSDENSDESQPIVDRPRLGVDGSLQSESRKP